MTRPGALGCVYLLCYAFPERARHYVGYTTADRLHHRMLEHVNGLGSIFTSRACELGARFVLARTFVPADRAFERAIMPEAIAQALCVHCSFRLLQADYRDHEKEPAPAVEAWEPVVWSTPMQIPPRKSRKRGAKHPKVGSVRPAPLGRP